MANLANLTWHTRQCSVVSICRCAPRRLVHFFLKTFLFLATASQAHQLNILCKQMAKKTVNIFLLFVSLVVVIFVQWSTFTSTNLFIYRMEKKIFLRNLSNQYNGSQWALMLFGYQHEDDVNNSNIFIFWGLSIPLRSITGQKL